MALSPWLLLYRRAALKTDGDGTGREGQAASAERPPNLLTPRPLLPPYSEMNPAAGAGEPAGPRAAATWTRTTRARPRDPAQLHTGSHRAARPRQPHWNSRPLFFFSVFPEATSATRTRPIKLAIPSEPSAHGGGAQPSPAAQGGASEPRDPIRRFARTQAVFYSRKATPREGEVREPGVRPCRVLFRRAKRQKEGGGRRGWGGHKHEHEHARTRSTPHTASKRRRPPSPPPARARPAPCSQRSAGGSARGPR